MKFIHPANEDFIKQGQDYLQHLISNNQKYWPMSVVYELNLLLRLWIVGFFFRVGDTDATPLLGALVVADKTALAHPAFADWMNARNLNNHLQITNLNVNISKWSIKSIIAGEAIYRALVCLFTDKNIKADWSDKRMYLHTQKHSILFNFGCPNQLTITNEPGYIPLNLDIVDGNPNPFIKFHGSWLESEIVRAATLITNTIQEHAAPPTPPEPPPLTGAMLIAKERERQMTEEGFDAQHDDKYINGELARLAACYTSTKTLYEMNYVGVDLAINAIQPKMALKRSNDTTRQLIKAGALIAAEIDRRQRQKEAIAKQAVAEIAHKQYSQP